MLSGWTMDLSMDLEGCAKPENVIECEPPSRDANSFIYHTCSVWVSVHLLPRAEGGTTMHSVSLDRSDRVLEYFSLGIASDCRLAP